MIKAVLFDYGGVLTEGGTSGCIQRIFGAIYGIDPLDINKDVDLIRRIQLDDLPGPDFLAEMNKRHPEGERATRANYLANSDIFEKSAPVYALADRLRQHRIATGILSNINDYAAEALREQGYYAGFEPVVLSYQEKMAKPNSRIYQLAAERLGVSPEHIIFVDDRKEYGPPATALGMRFVLATSPQQIVDEIQNIIQQENGLEL